MNLQDALAELIPDVGKLTDIGAVGGGCISDAYRVRVEDSQGRQRQWLVKRNEASFLDNFRCERDGLRLLAVPGVIGVPRAVAVGQAQDAAWLVTEWVNQGRQGNDFFGRFGRELAALHRSTLGNRIGWQRDNYLGSARQPNQAATDWVEFVAEQRIGFQIRWARQQGLASDLLSRDCEQIVAEMSQLLSGRDEATSLLHGDLWSGNYLCGSEGQPVIIDPAVYYGCREAELGMLRLFGSCPSEFYQAYDEAFGLPDGCQRRVSVYVLYHLLNHLNLFGRGYLGQCESVAAEILRF